MEIFYKTLPILCISLFLSACSPSDSSSTSPSDSNSTGSSDSDSIASSPIEGMSSKCVTLPRETKGLSYTRKITTTFRGATPTISKNKVTILETDNTSTTYEQETINNDGIVVGKATTTHTFKIANNYMDITSIENTQTSTVLGVTSVSTTKTTNSPYFRVAIDKVCEEQKWTTSFDSISTTTVNGEVTTSPPFSHEMNMSIVSVDEIKTTPLDTFVTVKKIQDTGDHKIIFWIDVITGILVYMETYDKNENLIMTFELL